MSELIELGKLAYETYCKEVGGKSVRGEDLPKWDDQSERLRIAWDKTALMVAMHSYGAVIDERKF
jgi:hypothetical protein